MKNLKYCQILLILFLVGCQTKTEREDYVARVNEEYLSLEEFKSAFSEEEWKSSDNSVKEKYLDEWVYLTLMAQECDRCGLSEELVIKEKIRNAARKIKANALIAEKLLDMTTSEEEELSFYQLNLRDYRKRIKEYKYQRILLKDKDRVLEVENKLAAGEKFKDLAQQYSEEAAGKSGGYINFVAEGNVDVAIWQALESAKSYECKRVFTGNEYYLLRWYEKRDMEIEMPFSDVREEIREKLLQESRQERFNRLKHELEESNDIEKKFYFNGDR